MKITSFLSASVILAIATSTVKAYGITECVMPGVVALTFDDGPGDYNAELLAKLADRGVTATFFVLGRSAKYLPDTLRATFDAGHEIASHTYDHPNLDTISKSQIQKQVESTANIIEGIIGVSPRFIRAPEGSCDTGKCQSVMRSFDQTVVYWNADTNDWQYTGQAKHNLQGALDDAMQQINDKIVYNSDPATDSFIILQHEIHQYSVEHLVDLVIDAVQDKGYRFVTMSECAGIPPYF
ncbi:hypothetical protein BGZ76_002772 [Entomortierella beljakovae]|nr:hypothetical protein BGZ76_002772 [Entomortierella beljakovae]